MLSYQHEMPRHEAQRDGAMVWSSGGAGSEHTKLLA